MNSKHIWLGVAIFISALLAVQPGIGISIEGGSSADSSSSGGSVSGGTFLNEWSYYPSNYRIEAGIFVDASIPEGSTGSIGYSYKGAQDILRMIELQGGTYDLDLKYDGSVEAKVTKSSTQGYANAHSSIETIGYIDSSYGNMISGTAKISSGITHSGVGSAYAIADGIASYDIINSGTTKRIHGEADGKTLVSSTNQKGADEGMTPYAWGSSGIYTESSSTTYPDTVWASTFSSIYSNIQASRPDNVGKAQIDGYAKGKADCYVIDNVSPRSTVTGDGKISVKASLPNQVAIDSWSITLSDYKYWDNSSPVTST